MLNNQGGFDIQEEPVYQRQEPQKKKEVELSGTTTHISLVFLSYLFIAEALFTKAKNSYKSRQFLDAKNSATKVLESDVLTGKLTVWYFFDSFLLFKHLAKIS